MVIRKPELLKGITKEMCLSITGLMEHRDEETYNPKIPSGTIELEAHKIDVLGRVYKQIPFEIQTSKAIREDVRLKYRYLDPVSYTHLDVYNRHHLDRTGTAIHLDTVYDHAFQTGGTFFPS